MTPEALAELHARAMEIPRPWSAKSFFDLLSSPGIFLIPHAISAPPIREKPETARNLNAFALGRVTLDEVELLTLAVDPAWQRRGLGRTCLRAFETEAKKAGAGLAFLEVAETNEAARALYRAEGWAETGRRKGYYRTGSGLIDAVLMQKPLTG